MRKISTTLAIAALLVIGWIASDDDTTPATEPAGEPAAATIPTPTPDQKDHGGDAAPTAESEPNSEDRTSPETDSPETTPNDPTDGDGGDGFRRNALTEKIAALSVASDDRGGYDRDDFGDYDRNALLEASLSAHGCDLSLADDQCHDDASEVHTDHIVALSETWRSGLVESDTDAIAENPDNLWLMTASENMSKSDDDPATWLPPEDDAVCTYIAAYIEIKIEYSLTVDPAEQDALIETAANC